METQSIKDRSLEITRLLNAPAELVYKVWTDPEHLKNWWGPKGFTTTIHYMDLQPGGKWNLTLHGPDGTSYKNESVFIEIVENKRIVSKHLTGPVFEMTATFEAQGDKTLFTMSMTFETAAIRQQTIDVFGADRGLIENVNKLEEYLTTSTYKS